MRYTDALVNDPHSIDDDLRATLAAEFTRPQLVELTATITFASAFSKAAIAWGPPPELPDRSAVTRPRLAASTPT